MKRIYLLMAAVVGLTSAASAQTRNIDLTLKHYYILGSGTSANEITDNSHILFDGDGNYEINVAFDIFNNNSVLADSVTLADTVKMSTVLFNFLDRFTIAGNGGHTGIFGVTGFPQAIAPGTDSGQPWDDFVSKPVTVDWCDSVWAVSANGSTMPLNETNPTDNKVCNSVIIDGWMTGIENVVISGNGLQVYPNPSNGNMSVVYNFGNNNSGVITIVDMTGKVVYTQQLAANLKGMQTIKVQTQGLANGLYSLRLATGNKVAVEKIYINN